MSDFEGHNDLEWPPGTVKIEDLYRGGEIILQPRPSADPNDPLNWAPWRKYLNFGLACLYVVFVFADINVVTPTWGPMNLQNGFSYELLNDSYAAGCAALAVGGPLLIPFALKYGRRPVYVISTIAQFAIAIWTAKLQTVGDLVAVNTLNCLFGALSEIIVQMTVADCFFVHERGRMNSWYCWFLNIGGALAPLAAGYITVNQGWRWVWWWMAIFFGISFLMYVFMFEESKYAPTHNGIDPNDLQDPSTIDHPIKSADTKVTASDSKDPEAATNPNTENQSANVEIDHTIPLKTYKQRLALWQTSPGSFSHFFRHSYQPLVVFATIPAVFYMALVYSIINSTLTVNITVMSEYLYDAPWNFDSGQIGLMGLPGFIGTSLGLLVCGPVSDWGILFLAKRNKGIYEPEMRLWVTAAFIPFVPAGVFMFGFGLANGSSWPVLAVGSGLLSFGTAPASSIALTYLTDAYTDIVADSMVSITVTRNIVATIFVFAISPWVDGIGLKNVYVMLGVLMTVILASVFIFIYFGKKLRIRTAGRYRYYARRQIDSRKLLV